MWLCHLCAYLCVWCCLNRTVSAGRYYQIIPSEFWRAVSEGRQQPVSRNNHLKPLRVHFDAPRLSPPQETPNLPDKPKEHLLKISNINVFQLSCVWMPQYTVLLCNYVFVREKYLFANIVHECMNSSSRVCGEGNPKRNWQFCLFAVKNYFI